MRITFRSGAHESFPSHTLGALLVHGDVVMAHLFIAERGRSYVAVGGLESREHPREGGRLRAKATASAMACLSRYPVGLRSCQNVSLTNDPADSPQTLQNVKGKTCSPVFFSLASQVRSLVFRIFRYRWRPKGIGSFLSIGARAQEWSALRPRRAAQSLRRRGRPRVGV